MPLVNAIKSLAFARDLSRVQEIVRNAARELTGADGASFVLREDDQCRYLDESAISPLWKGMSFSMDECVSGWSMIHRQSAVIPDIYADPRVPVEAYRPTFVKSMVVVPIRSLDPVGAIGIYWAHAHKATEQELRILEGLADATALAMENVLMYDELEERVRERTRELEQSRESARRAQQAAEQANHSKSRFLATATHDLRQPLQVLALLNGSLREMVHDPDAMGILQRQEHALAASTRLVNTLLDMSKLESGVIAPEISDVPVAELFADLEQAYAGVANGKGLGFTAEAVGANVRSDPVLVGEILGNLVSNAIKYTQDGSVTLRAREGDGIVSIEVADTGIGMSPGQLEHIYDEFYQAEKPKDGERQGAGLGLSIVDRAVKLLDLKIEVRSQPGEGTVFTLDLPLACT